jgi:hypothetical protein
LTQGRKAYRRLLKKWQIGRRGDAEIISAEKVEFILLRGCGEISIFAIALPACGRLRATSGWRMPVLSLG